MSLFDSASVVITPSGYKEDKLYSIKPTDGSGDLVVTRATTATRVNSAGLVEVVPRNLIQQSETFDTTWTKYNSATITNNAIVAPNGTTTADLLISGSAQEIYSANMPKASEELFFTFSCYAKIYNTNVFQMVCSDFATSGTFANFNLSTLTVNVTTGATWSNSSGSITNVGNGWYRCVFTSKSPNTSGLYLSLTTTGTNSVSGVYIWGAQVEQGSTATEYFPTTDRLNVPRIDYTNGSCPSILVEPQRTNVILRSQEFDNAYWIKQNASIVINSTTSPDGTLNASKLVEDTANSRHYINANNTIVTATQQTASIYIKAAGRTKFALSEEVATGAYASFNLANGTVLDQNGISAKITALTNGWFKCEYTINSTIFFLLRIVLLPNSYTSGSVNGTYTGDGTSGVFLYGAQLEQGSYSTSYIPTVASSVTRNADVISKTGISSLIGQTEGTIFVDASNLYTSGNRSIILVYTSGSAFYQIYLNSSNQVRVDVNGSFLFAGGTISANTRYKIAFAYKSGQYALYINGTQIATSTSSTIPSSLNDYYLGNSLGSEQSGSYKEAVLWKTRLTNTELATLTTI
jgi:hypothetical protein